MQTGPDRDSGPRGRGPTALIPELCALDRLIRDGGWASAAAGGLREAIDLSGASAGFVAARCDEFSLSVMGHVHAADLGLADQQSGGSSGCAATAGCALDVGLRENFIRALEGGAPVLADDADTELLVEAGRLFGVPVRRLLAVPVIYEGRLVGVLGLAGGAAELPREAQAPLTRLAAVCAPLCAGFQRDAHAMPAIESFALGERAALDRFLAVAPIGVLLVGTGGTIEGASTPAANLFGYTVDRLVGMAVDELVPANSRPDHEAYRNEYDRGSRPILMAKHREVRGIRSDGTSVRVEVGLAPLRLEGSTITMATIVDVSQRVSTARELEERVAERTEELRLVTEGVPTGIAHVGADGRYKFTNSHYRDFHGLVAADLTGARLEDVLSAERLAIAQPYLKRVLSGERVEFEAEMPTAAGGSRFVIARCVPEVRDGSVIGLYALLTDISERRRSEVALQEREHELRTLLEHSRAIPWRVDLRSGRFVYLGKGIEELLGYSMSSWDTIEVWASRIHADDREEAVRYCAAETAEGRDHEFEYRAVAKDGRVVWIRDIVSIVTRSDGVVELLGFLFDITKRRVLEEQLRQSQKMEAVGRMAGGIAHDFNNILMPIVGYVEKARHSLPADSPSRSDLEQVLVASRRATSLVEQILTFSRSGPHVAESVSVQAVLAEVAPLVRGTLPTNISLELAVDEECPTICADSTKVHQVILNLCANAAHAMRDTGGVLRISLGIVPTTEHLRNAAGIGGCERVVRLCVNDTGHGMSAEVRRRVFDPFFTTKGVGEGTGLGLSVIHGIAKEVGGGVLIESAPGAGATVSVFFPPDRAGSSAPKAKESEAAVCGSECVLWVDDDAQIAAMGTAMLEPLGYSVVEAHSAEDALEVMGRDDVCIDLIVTDLTMPGMSGLDLAKRIAGSRTSTPVIIMSGYSEKISVNEVASGVVACLLRKPFTTEAVGRAIRDAMTTRGKSSA